PTGTTTYTVTGTATNGCTNTATVTVTVNALPTVTTISLPDTICAGESSVLTASGASTYEWSHGLGTGSSKTVTPTATTTYTVTGTAANGCTNSASITITVHPLPSLVVTATPPTLCPGSSSVLSVTGADTYVWNAGLGTGSGITVTPAATTTYTVTGTSVYGCIQTGSITVFVDSLIQVSITASDTAICMGDSITLNAVGAVQYTWSHGLGSGAAMMVAPTTNTTYSVTGTDPNGCSNAASITITVSPLPVVTASASKDTLCAGDTAFLSATGAYTYHWSYGTGTGIGSGIVVVPATTTIYTVTGTDMQGCANTASLPVTILPLPVATITPDTTLCPDTWLTLVATGGVNYLWSNQITSQQFLFYAQTSTQFSVTVTDTNGCQTTKQTQIGVYAVPVLGLQPQPQLCADDPPWIPDMVLPAGGQYSGNGITGTFFDPAAAGPGTHLITYTYATANCMVDTTFPLIVDNLYSLSGHVYYDNSIQTLMDSTGILLQSLPAAVSDSQATQSGLFRFGCKPTGAYSLMPFTQASWGGVNANDALQAALYSVSQISLSPLRALAADVNASGSVNAGDALMILRRFVNLVDTFPSGDWLLPSVPVNLQTGGIQGLGVPILCFGDVDGSYQPFTKAQAMMEMFTHPALVSPSDGMIRLPLHLETDAAICASVSLILRLGPGQQVRDVEKAPPGTIWKQEGDILRLGWFDLQGKHFDRQAFATLVLEETATPVQPSLMPGSMAGDASARILTGARLGIPRVSTPVASNKLHLQAVPNPGREQVKVSVLHAQAGKLQHSLLDMTGKVLQSGEAYTEKAGTFVLEINMQAMAPGAYQLMVTQGSPSGMERATTTIIRIP
ncbi:MAG TPA: hypothetical protein PLE85_02610, partial [Bacteroidales bacterium]|nr:hypothetical protein [Bacteroidales bacterium]